MLNLIDMYWSRPSLNKHWMVIFHTLSQVLNVKLEQNPLLALFGVTGGEMQLTAEKRGTLSSVFPPGSASSTAQTERHSPAYSHTVVDGHHVLLKI